MRHGEAVEVFGSVARGFEGVRIAFVDNFARELEVPAGGGVGTARAIARAYSCSGPAAAS